MMVNGRKGKRSDQAVRSFAPTPVAWVFCLLVGLMLVLMTSTAGAAAPARPFPQATSEDPLAKGIIRPQGMTQAAMNDAVSEYYAYWKKAYLKPSKKVPGDYKVDFDGTGETVSEAIGYGMLITVTMAGSDKEAKNYFANFQSTC